MITYKDAGVNIEEGYKSVKDIVIITPAEKERANVINLLLLDFEKKTIKAPITVDKPASRDRINGNIACLSNI